MFKVKYTDVDLLSPPYIKKYRTTGFFTLWPVTKLLDPKNQNQVAKKTLHSMCNSSRRALLLWVWGSTCSCGLRMRPVRQRLPSLVACVHVLVYVRRLIGSRGLVHVNSSKQQRWNYDAGVGSVVFHQMSVKVDPQLHRNRRSWDDKDDTPQTLFYTAYTYRSWK